MLSVFLILFGAFGCGGSEDDFYLDQPDPTEVEDEPSSDHRLVVDLQDGFSADTVLIEVNGELVWEEKEVTTALLTGLAATVETTVSEGAATLTVRITTRDIFSSIDLEVDADNYVGVSVVDGGIQFFVSDSPFGYG